MDDGEVVVVSLLESFACSNANEDSNEVRVETVQNKETPMLTAVNEEAPVITAHLSNPLIELTISVNMRRMDITEYDDTGQGTHTKLPCGKLEGLGSDFNLSFPDYGGMIKPKVHIPILKQFTSSNKRK